MKLPRAGREYAHFWIADIAVADVPLSGWTVTLADGSSALPATVTTDPAELAKYKAPDGTVAAVRILVYGPDCTDTTQGALVAAYCKPTVTCTSTPEIIVRQGGRIELV